MKCPNCSTNLDDSARFCSSCGITIDRERPQAPKSVPKRPLIAAMIVILLLLAVAGLFALLHRGGDQSVVQAPNVPPATRSVVQTPVPATGRPMTQVEVPTTPAMPHAPPPEVAPPEVIDYIDFIKQAEVARQRLNRDYQSAMTQYLSGSIGPLMKMLDDPEADTTPVSEPDKEVSRHLRDADQLVRIFDAKEAPPACRDLRGSYREAIGRYVTWMARLESILAQQKPDVMAAQNMLNKVGPDLASGFLQANTQLDKVRDRYGLPKTFAIEPDPDIPGTPSLHPGGTIVGH